MTSNRFLLAVLALCIGGVILPGATGSVCSTGNVCSNGGVCPTSGNTPCNCKGGYSGDTCETAPATCSASTVEDCHFHASCSGSTCVCLGLYAGDKCETAPTSGPCKTDPCGHHGTCTLDETDQTKPKCICRDNYSGTTCTDAPCSATTEKECNFHASCSGSKCVCLGLYTGDKCQTAPASGPCTPDPCGDHGTCTLDETDQTKSKCICRDNYSGTTCRDAATPNPIGNLTTTKKSKGSRISETSGLIALILLVITFCL